MLNIINNLVGLTLGQPQIPTNIYWGFFMPTYTTIYKRRVNIKYPNTHRSYQNINNWTNVGPTLHTSTQHKVANFHVNISSLDQRWANIICPTRYWPRFMPTFTTMDQHCIPNTDGQAFLPTYHPLDHFINVGPTFKLRRQQSTNHSTNVGPTQSFYLGCRLIKIGYTFLRQSYYIRVQYSTYFSANGCREHTNEPLSNFFL